MVAIQERTALLLHLQSLGLQFDEHGSYSQPHDERGYAVSLEQFFDGNNFVDGSFAANMPDHPGIAVRAILERLRATPGVVDVQVGITAIENEDATYPDGWWPYSDHLYVIATALEEDVLTQFDPNTMPSEISRLTPDWYPHGLTAIPAGAQAYILLWD